ncbi:MAG: hypothetical protein C0598_02035 [Marinilabiliales bacterium]|nr:MAG: hypothetical protein C0598_02035 [Marinilabiliales bacterium]
MAKKAKSRKKKSNNNSFGKIAIIVLILAILSVVIAYFVLNKDDFNFSQTIEKVYDNESDTQTIKKDETKVKTAINPLKGTWVSNYDGTMLTINGNNFTLEMPSVDASSKIKGSIIIEKTIATFINDADAADCPKTEGHYSFSFENEELVLSLIKDKCELRIRRMSASWFKI